MKSAHWNGLELLPSRAVWRAQSRTLFVADVHIGKAAAFRAAGLPAPAGTTRENLARLDALLAELQPRALVVLGDLFHARAAFRAASIGEFAAWRKAHAGLAIRLVAGNHDRSAGPPPPGLDLEIVDEPHLFEGFECRHHPLDDPAPEGPPILAGHLHPTARLSGPGYDRLRLPCFVLGARQLVLPAFGEFTGGAAQRPDVASTLYIAADDRLVAIPALPARPQSARGGSLERRIV